LDWKNTGVTFLVRRPKSLIARLRRRAWNPGNTDAAFEGIEARWPGTAGLSQQSQLSAVCMHGPIRVVYPEGIGIAHARQKVWNESSRTFDRGKGLEEVRFCKEPMK